MRYMYNITSLSLLLLQGIFTSPTQAGLGPISKDCKHPIVRKEWRTLSKPEQLHYIASVQCALRKPGITPPSIASGVVSRYDDLVATHIIQAYSIHLVGQFLPWHRLFTVYYERMLRNECGYRGAQPYWDWTLDATVEKFPKSPIFDATYGFGGNGPYIPYNETMGEIYGRSGGGCIQTGPFRNLTVHLGPINNTARNDQCLRRDFASGYASWTLTQAKVDDLLAKPDFGWFGRYVERASFDNMSQVHTGGHMSVGGNYGQMSDGSAAPADPIFWLHHANIDRVWWSWQTRKKEERLKDISGNIILGDYFNMFGGNVTLDFPLSLGANNWDAKIADVMDIAPLCYTYDKLY